MNSNAYTIVAALSAWATTHGIATVFIVVLAIVVRWLSGAVLERAIRRLVPGRRFQTAEAEKQREDTLISISRSTIGVLIWTVAVLMVLSEVGVNIGPLLAAAGVAGLAVGFGGQYLIRDVVAGLFIILENQYRVGDVVCLDSTCGLVEGITIRMATLRDLDGTVHHVPHGVISKVSNLTKGYARVNLNVGVSYRAPLEQVIKVVNDTGKALADDPAWKARIISPPQFLRVDDFADSAVIVKILGDTKPLAQWDVTGELRKRLKIAFDQAGIEIPFPQRVVHTASSPHTA